MHRKTQLPTHNSSSYPKGLTPAGWLKAFVSAGQKPSQLRWCHHRLSHGSKPLSSSTTTKKSLCRIEPTRIGENEGCFRSFLFWRVTFSAVFPSICLFSVFQDSSPDFPVTNSLSLSSVFSHLLLLPKVVLHHAAECVSWSLFHLIVFVLHLPCLSIFH